MFDPLFEKSRGKFELKTQRNLEAIEAHFGTKVAPTPEPRIYRIWRRFKQREKLSEFEVEKWSRI